MNRRGFTLVELLATIIVLAVVVGITIPVTINGINKAKKKQQDILVANIQSAVANLNTECAGDSFSLCSELSKNRPITLSELAEFGFLSFDKTDSSGKPIIENPYNEINADITCGKNCIDVSNCKIYIHTHGTYGFCSPVESLCGAIPDKCKFLISGASSY